MKITRTERVPKKCKQKRRRKHGQKSAKKSANKKCLKKGPRKMAEKSEFESAKNRKLLLKVHLRLLFKVLKILLPFKSS